MEGARPSFLSVKEMQDLWATTDVINAYKAELAYEKEHGNHEENGPSDPSQGFITARQYRDFHAWCPVKYSHPTLTDTIMVYSIARPSELIRYQTNSTFYL